MDQVPIQNNKSSPRILVVEDEEFLRELYVDILKNEGFSVEEAKDGEEALTKMQNGGYDLILLDIILPKIDGYAILKRLQSQPPKIANKAIVCLTNLEQQASIAKGVELGVQGYLVKSDYTPNQLLSEIKRYLQ